MSNADVQKQLAVALYRLKMAQRELEKTRQLLPEIPWGSTP